MTFVQCFNAGLVKKINLGLKIYVKVSNVTPSIYTVLVFTVKFGFTRS